jgi:phage N-6-adenine-methyltransferase
MGAIRLEQTMLTRTRTTDLALYDPDKGLKTIAVSEAAITHWKRAKDASKLFTAIKEKILAQADYIVWRDGVVEPSRQSGGRVSVLKPGLPAADPGKLIAHRWRKKFCRTTKAKKRQTRLDDKKLKQAIEEAHYRSCRICEQEKDGTVRGTEGTGEFERYTPKKYIKAARLVLGSIDLDPASNKTAQETVRAKEYFTVKDDGLKQEWHGCVWLNPPYHRDLAPRFIEKLTSEFRAGRTKAAVLLVNNSTDTDWFDIAIRHCASLCFTHGRIHFLEPNGNPVLPTQGQAFFYFGKNVKRFEIVFSRIGPCMRVIKNYSK